MTERVTFPAPLQCFFPHLGANSDRPLVRRAIEQAFEAWDGDAGVWFLPHLERPTRWKEAGVSILAVPARFLDYADVVQVGLNGYAFEPLNAGRFPNGSVAQLWDAWLQVRPEQITWWEPPKSLTLMAPHLHNGVIRHRKRTVNLSRGAAFGGTIRGRRLRLRLTTQPTEPPLSAEAEASPVPAGPFEAVTVQLKSGKALPLMPLWPDSVRALYPRVGRIDDVVEFLRMRAVITQSERELHSAAEAAHRPAARYQFQGSACRELAEFRPLWVQFSEGLAGKEGQERKWGAVSGALSTRNLPAARSLDEALRSERWRQYMTEQVPVTRVWGASGLLWALLATQLERGRPVRSCTICGRLFSGDRRRSDCGSESCHRAMAANRKARQRARERRKQ